MFRSPSPSLSWRWVGRSGKKKRKKEWKLDKRVLTECGIEFQIDAPILVKHFFTFSVLEKLTEKHSFADNRVFEWYFVLIFANLLRRLFGAVLAWTSYIKRQSPYLTAFLSISDSRKLLPYLFAINITIHLIINNEIAVIIRKLFILLPFPAFHCWTTVGG